MGRSYKWCRGVRDESGGQSLWAESCMMSVLCCAVAVLCCAMAVLCCALPVP